VDGRSGRSDPSCGPRGDHLVVLQRKFLEPIERLHLRSDDVLQHVRGVDIYEPEFGLIFAASCAPLRAVSWETLVLHIGD
jgi:hypothetical protein